MIMCEVAVGLLIHYNFQSPGNEGMSKAIVALICIYVAGFAWSWCVGFGWWGSGVGGARGCCGSAWCVCVGGGEVVNKWGDGRGLVLGVQLQLVVGSY